MTSDSPIPEPVDHFSVTDRDLVQAMRQGQIEALGVLYDRYAKLVYGLALRILSNTEEAEDVAQEVFLSLWHRQTYDPSRGSLSSFLMTMTRSRSIDKLRSRNTGFRFLQRWKGLTREELSSSTPLEQASISERSERVRHALAQLPEAEREILQIAYYEGLSQSEIAQRLNMPLGTVKTRSRQGLLKLRKILQDCV
ncbi:sigma-70 family RNA polymerase sigma factor [Thermocoleostomius sinensis]|uniref:Sigma-70 family RNA polymerase sigma factor n=1 Tax=Thermocoleostomius sinensis A174 TaxID=2016057 RepID=A0A9E8Z9Z6_9CYAN|nr:sigma-70 family RNA polymerase sigma factor [Thermocoleostomius sinensis]WAL59293.1 sigma-70 family RNA polymerase sigma factor [Thermocoleostomius sinensis A174]